MHTDCIFCKIIAGTIPATIIWQDEDIIVIKDIHPKAPIHNLIIPKKHIKDQLSLTKDDAHLAYKLFVEVPQVLIKLLPGATAFNSVVNNGAGAGQIIFHLHVHFLSGKNFFNV